MNDLADISYGAHEQPMGERFYFGLLSPQQNVIEEWMIEVHLDPLQAD